MSNIPFNRGCDEDEMLEFMDDAHLNGKWSNMKFSHKDLFVDVLGRLREDKNVIVTDHGMYEVKKNMASIPALCHVSRFIWGIRLYLLVALIVTFSAVKVKHLFDQRKASIIKSKEEEEKVDMVVKDIIVHLKEINKSTNYADRSCAKDFLRDNYLGINYDSKSMLWERVEKIIEADGRIRVIPKPMNKQHWCWV